MKIKVKNIPAYTGTNEIKATVKEQQNPEQYLPGATINRAVISIAGNYMQAHVLQLMHGALS